MFSNWQRKYEDEAERLVEALRRWHTLKSEIKRLEWELERCQNPEASGSSLLEEVPIPVWVQRAEAGKPIVPNTKRGMERGWNSKGRG